MQDFKGKLAVITGGASGVGRSLAFALGAEGARVLIADVDEAGLEATEAALIERNIDARSQRCDVSTQAELDALAATAFEELGGAHLVFANAGVSAGEAGNLWEYSPHDWQWTFNVNFWGVIHSINAFMPRLTAQGEESHLVVTGSGNGAFIVYPDQPVYTATKAAIQAVTEALHIQSRNQQSPVQIHALFPGPHIVETGIFDSDRVRPEAFTKPEGTPRQASIRRRICARSWSSWATSWSPPTRTRWRRRRSKGCATNNSGSPRSTPARRTRSGRGSTRSSIAVNCRFQRWANGRTPGTDWTAGVGAPILTMDRVGCAKTIRG